jgi:large subunit ribosomal protein L4
MLKVDILNKDSKPVGKVDLPSDIFGVEVKKGILHEVVRNYLANQRQGTAVTKTRGVVSGGGRKPYKQKGTGRARAGSIRSPLWKGGGTVFGPLRRDYSYKLPKKVRWAALGAAFSAKLSDGEIVVVEDLPIAEPKTKDLVSLLRGLELRNVLIILPEDNKVIKLAARNIPNVDIAIVGRLNVYEVLVHEKLLMTRETVERMKKVYLE